MTPTMPRRLRRTRTRHEVHLLERTLPSFALDSASGAGHFVQEEQPEAVVTAVRELWVTAALAGPVTTAR
jgi:pimeloyl-ACP methyl ester carboxylesterase